MNRILIIRRGSLGDFLLLVPSLALLRREFPNARLEALGRPEILSVVCPGLLDAALSVESSIFLPVFESPDRSSPKATEILASADMVLAFINDSEGFLGWNLERLGIKHVLVKSPFPSEGERIHVASYLYQITVSFLERALSISLPPFPPNNQSHVLHFTEDDVRQAQSFPAHVGQSEQGAIAVHPGSGSERKCWPLEHFEALAGRLLKNGRKVIWILGPADGRLADHLRVSAGKLNISIADSLPLRRLAIILSKCAAYVGNDSGITHLAALTGIPTLAVFGPTDSAVWGPVGRSVRTIQSSADCSPCSRSEMHACERRVCLESVPEETVAEELFKLLHQQEQP
jgi:ADP-heptose:LPS heptosyltransferase